MAQIGGIHIQKAHEYKAECDLLEICRRPFVNIKSQKDFYSGLMFTVLGLAFVYGASSYNLGTGARMGPGYFPTLLGAVLTILGVLITVTGFTSKAEGGDKIGKWAWKPLFFVLTSNLIFGVLLGGLPKLGIPYMGLIAGIFGLVLVASLAGEVFKLKEVLILSVVLSIGSYLAFVLLLKLQLPVWPAFITG